MGHRDISSYFVEGIEIFKHVSSKNFEGKRKECLHIRSTCLCILYFILHYQSANALSLFPDMFKYKTCADSAPEFSLGCMANVTVNIGERATFNCQVDPQCIIQFVHWYHEPEIGEKRLIK